MDRFIVDENEDETDQDVNLVVPTVKRHKRAHLVTFLFWCATLISFIDRYSLSGVLSEGNKGFICVGTFFERLGLNGQTDNHFEIIISL